MQKLCALCNSSQSKIVLEDVAIHFTSHHFHLMYLIQSGIIFEQGVYIISNVENWLVYDLLIALQKSERERERECRDVLFL